MNAFCWTIIIFLLFGWSSSEQYDDKFMEQIYKYELLKNYEPIDFRCSQMAYSRFSFSEFTFMYYELIDPNAIGCVRKANRKYTIFYPTPTALDPMFTFYINKAYEGIALVVESPKFPYYIPYTPERRKKYCLDVRVIGSTFVDYIELFHSDDETCWKMMEIAKECHIFRQVWNIWIKDLYERLCMDEDGCYKTMELYEEEMPHCVKYIAKSQFQNVTFGSWHHSVINYCQLSDMVPDAKHTNYDQSILFEDGKTEDDLMTMCQFLRFRLLPEEGKEEEIREITLERREDRATDKKKDSAAFLPARAVHGAIILQVISANTLL